MKKYTLLNILFILPVLFVLTSCFDTTVEQATEGKITDFYVKDQAGLIGVTKIEFTVTQPLSEEDTGLITNPYEVFPYGSLKDSIKVTLNAEDQSYIYWRHATQVEVDSVMVDTVLFTSVISGNTFIDLSDTAMLVVISEDGTGATYYHVVVNSDPVNPVSVEWTQKNEHVGFGLTSYFNAFYLDDKLFVLTGDIVPGSDSVYTKLVSSSDGKTWNEVALPAEFPRGIYHTVEVFNNTVYIIGYIGWNKTSHSFSAKEELWSSQNGTSWQKTDYPAGMSGVFKNAGAFNGKLVVWGGSSLNATAATVEAMPYNADGSIPDPDYSVWYFDGSTWERGAAIPNGMPVRFSVSCEFEDRGQLYGGELANGENSNVFWSHENNNYWKKYPANNDFETLAQTSLISWDRNLWLFGGINTEGATMNTIQVSKNEGLSFRSIYDLKDDNMFPDLNYQMRANQQVVKLPNKTVYVIGGTYRTLRAVTIVDDIEYEVVVTPLYDVWEAKMVKFTR